MEAKSGLDLPSSGVGSLAPVLTRFGARFIDGFVFFGLQLVIVLSQFALTGDFEWAIPWPLQVAVGAAGVLYEVTMVAVWGQTLGKMASGIRVVSTTDQQVPGWSSSVRRAIVFDGPPFLQTVFATTSPIASNAAFGIFLVDGLWMVRDRNNQSQHDKLAGTVVVRTERAVEIEERRKGRKR